MTTDQVILAYQETKKQIAWQISALNCSKLTLILDWKPPKLKI